MSGCSTSLIGSPRATFSSLVLALLSTESRLKPRSQLRKQEPPNDALSTTDRMAGKRAVAGHPLNGHGMKAKEPSGGGGIHKRFKVHKRARVTSIDHFKSPGLNRIDIVPKSNAPTRLSGSAGEIKDRSRPLKIGMLRPMVIRRSKKKWGGRLFPSPTLPLRVPTAKK
jgi:hypothetical protein